MVPLLSKLKETWGWSCLNFVGHTVLTPQERLYPSKEWMGVGRKKVETEEREGGGSAFGV